MNIENFELSAIGSPTTRPTPIPTPSPTRPTPQPNPIPTPKPTLTPTAVPTRPTVTPTFQPSVKPIPAPSTVPTPKPTAVPTLYPTEIQPGKAPKGYIYQNIYDGPQCGTIQIPGPTYVYGYAAGTCLPVYNEITGAVEGSVYICTYIFALTRSIDFCIPAI